jgi:tocopherol cyclase
MIFRNIIKIWQPAMYQGKNRMQGYFEGWYYKFTDKHGQNTGAIIPGVSFSPDGKHSHSFIQYLDNSGVFSRYYSFDIKYFTYAQNKPEIRIKDSFFSPSGIDIDIQDGSDNIKGSLRFRGINPWPVSLFNPGAMGWYAFVPFMQCYHGVLSFDHEIEGQLTLNSKNVVFNGGRGYIEKDWGRSFPSYHIWLQTNHFEEVGTSLMVSIANIPWLGKYFDGFLIGFWYQNHLYKFTTYTGAKISLFQYQQGFLILHVESRQHRLEIQIPYTRGAQLLTPVLGEMRGRLSESLQGETSLQFYEFTKSGIRLIYRGLGRHTGLEIEGNIPEKLKR